MSLLHGSSLPSSKRDRTIPYTYEAQVDRLRGAGAQPRLAGSYFADTLCGLVELLAGEGIAPAQARLFAVYRRGADAPGRRALPRGRRDLAAAAAALPRARAALPRDRRRALPGARRGRVLRLRGPGHDGARSLLKGIVPEHWMMEVAMKRMLVVAVAGVLAAASAAAIPPPVYDFCGAATAVAVDPAGHAAYAGNTCDGDNQVLDHLCGGFVTHMGHEDYYAIPLAPGQSFTAVVAHGGDAVLLVTDVCIVFGMIILCLGGRRRGRSRRRRDGLLHESGYRGDVLPRDRQPQPGGLRRLHPRSQLLDGPVGGGGGAGELRHGQGRDR